MDSAASAASLMRWSSRIAASDGGMGAVAHGRDHTSANARQNDAAPGASRG